MSVSGSDDDFCTSVSDTNFTSRVTFFGKFTSEEFVEFGCEDSVSNELDEERREEERVSWVVGEKADKRSSLARFDCKDFKE